MGPRGQWSGSPTPTPPFIHHRQGGHRQNGFTPGDYGQEELGGKGGGWNKGTFPSGCLLLGNTVLGTILGNCSLAFFQTLCFPSQRKIFPLSCQSNFFLICDFYIFKKLPLINKCSLHSPVLHQCVMLVSQSCLTLCDPVDCNPPDSSVCGILQARILERVAISPPGDLPDPEWNLNLLHWQADSLPSERPGKPSCINMSM